MSKVNPPQGMRDILPEDYFLRDALISVIRRVYESYGYVPIDTPAPERLEYLTAKAGSEAEQLMFKLLKRGNSLERAIADGDTLGDMALRFDLTVSLCRFYATNEASLPKVFRRYQIAPVWRAEHPQYARFREFYQCDVDVIGDKTLLPECEVILAITDAMRAIQVPDFFVKLSDRRILPTIFRAMDFDSVQIRKAMVSVDKLDKVGVAKVLTESEGYLDESRRAHFARFLGDITTTTDLDVSPQSLGEWGQRCADQLGPLFDNLKAIRRMIGAVDDVLPLRFWPSLVRGMGYYTGPIFEVWDHEHNFSLAGGGRYDEMIGMFLGREIPACGFSIGFERILTVMKERGTVPTRRTRAQVLVAAKDDGLVGTSLRLASELRRDGIATEVHPFSLKLNRYFDHAKCVGIPYVVLLSGNDANLTIELANTSDRTRVKGSWENVVSSLRSHLGS